MGKFIFTQTEIPGVVVIEPQVFGDDRGYFMETWRKADFENRVGYCVDFVQENESKSVRDVLRGLHYQRGGERSSTWPSTCGSILPPSVGMPW